MTHQQIAHFCDSKKYLLDTIIDSKHKMNRSDTLLFYNMIMCNEIACHRQSVCISNTD